MDCNVSKNPLGRNEKSDLQNICWVPETLQKKKSTPPKLNIAPEKWWLEDEFPFGIAYFWRPC